MFSKAKGKGQGDATQPNEAKMAQEPLDQMNKRAASKQSARPRPSRPAGVPSIVSGDMMIRGEIESAGEIQFDGEIDGDIRAKGLVIGESAKVVGEVVADKVRVAGTVEGAIRAVEVELAPSAFVKGDIIHTSLSIESGARFEGNCRHSDDPVGESGSAPSLGPRIVKPQVDDTSSDARATSLTGNAPKDVMPRSEPVADRSLVKRAATDLR